MVCQVAKRHSRVAYKVFSAFLAFTFAFTTILPPSYAQSLGLLNLPVPGTMVPPSPAFAPVLLKGMTIHPEDPFRFDFIIDSGNTNFKPDKIKVESEKLVKYFLASLTVPKDDLWVNLSPYEDDRIIPDELGKTELGRDMLAQDYILKQLTASLMYPEEELGKKFWDRVYKKAEEQFGTSEIPVNTFNKVWILPQTATVYEHEQTVYVVDAHLKVMLDEDYVAAQDSSSPLSQRGARGDLKAGTFENPPKSPFSKGGLSTTIIREIILPEIEREVNEGKNFAPLRQIYHSLILAKWYKETVKESLLSKVYVDKKKIAGVNVDDETIKDQIYDRYIAAYKKGVFNYIREDYDRLSQELIPRKYFSGGEEWTNIPLERSSSPVRESKTPQYRARVKVVRQGERVSSPVDAMEREDDFLKKVRALGAQQYSPEKIVSMITVDKSLVPIGDMFDKYKNLYDVVMRNGGLELLVQLILELNVGFSELERTSKEIMGQEVLKIFVQNNSLKAYYQAELVYAFMVSQEAREAFLDFVRHWEGGGESIYDLDMMKRIRQPVALFLANSQTRHQTASFIRHIKFDNQFWHPDDLENDHRRAVMVSHDEPISFFWFYLAPLFDEFKRRLGSDEEAAKMVLYFHNHFFHILKRANVYIRDRDFGWTRWNQDKIDKFEVERIVEATIADAAVRGSSPLTQNFPSPSSSPGASASSPVKVSVDWHSDGIIVRMTKDGGQEHKAEVALTLPKLRERVDSFGSKIKGKTLDQLKISLESWTALKSALQGFITIYHDSYKYREGEAADHRSIYLAEAENLRYLIQQVVYDVQDAIQSSSPVVEKIDPNVELDISLEDARIYAQKVAQAEWYQHNLSNDLSELVDRISDSGEDVVVDASAGTGAATLFLLEQLRAEGKKIKKLVLTDIDTKLSRSYMEYNKRQLWDEERQAVRDEYKDVVDDMEFYILKSTDPESRSMSFAVLSDIPGLQADHVIFENAVHLVPEGELVRTFTGIRAIMKPGATLTIGSGDLGKESRPKNTVGIHDLFDFVRERALEIIRTEDQYKIIRAAMDELKGDPRVDGIRRKLFPGSVPVATIADALVQAGFDKATTAPIHIETKLEREDYRPFITGIFKLVQPGVFSELWVLRRSNDFAEQTAEIADRAYDDVYDERGGDPFELFWTKFVVVKPTSSSPLTEDEAEGTPFSSPVNDNIEQYPLPSDENLEKYTVSVRFHEAVYGPGKNEQVEITVERQLINGLLLVNVVSDSLSRRGLVREETFRRNLKHMKFGDLGDDDKRSNHMSIESISRGIAVIRTLSDGLIELTWDYLEGTRIEFDLNAFEHNNESDALLVSTVSAKRDGAKKEATGFIKTSDFYRYFNSLMMNASQFNHGYWNFEYIFDQLQNALASSINYQEISNAIDVESARYAARLVHKQVSHLVSRKIISKAFLPLAGYRKKTKQKKNMLLLLRKTDGRVLDSEMLIVIEAYIRMIADMFDLVAVTGLDNLSGEPTQLGVRHKSLNTKRNLLKIGEKIQEQLELHLYRLNQPNYSGDPGAVDVLRRLKREVENANETASPVTNNEKSQFSPSSPPSSSPVEKSGNGDSSKGKLPVKSEGKEVVISTRSTEIPILPKMLGVLRTALESQLSPEGGPVEIAEIWEETIAQEFSFEDQIKAMREFSVIRGDSRTFYLGPNLEEFPQLEFDFALKGAFSRITDKRHKPRMRQFILDSNENINVRELVAKPFVVLTTEEDISDLIFILDNPDIFSPSVLRETAEHLKNFDEKKVGVAVPALSQTFVMVFGEDQQRLGGEILQDTAAVVLETLVHIDHASVIYFGGQETTAGEMALRLLTSIESTTRRNAINIVTTPNFPQAIPALVERAYVESDESIRSYVLQRIERLDPSVELQFLALVNDWRMVSIEGFIELVGKREITWHQGYWHETLSISQDEFIEYISNMRRKNLSELEGHEIELLVERFWQALSLAEVLFSQSQVDLSYTGRYVGAAIAINSILNRAGLEDSSRQIRLEEVEKLLNARFDEDNPKGAAPDSPMDAPSSSPVENTALVVVANKYGRYGNMLMGYPISYYLGLPDGRNTATFLLHGTSADELRADFYQHYPQMARYGFQIIPDGSTWLLFYGTEIPSQQLEKKKVFETKTSMNQTVRVLPEVVRLFDDMMIGNLSGAWTPTLQALLEIIKKRYHMFYESFHEGEIAVAVNGQHVSDLSKTLILKEKDEITFLPPIVELPEPPQRRVGGSGITALLSDLTDWAAIKAFFEEPLAYPEGLSGEQKRWIDKTTQSAEEREILSKYLLGEFPFSYALKKLTDLGFSDQLAEALLKRVERTAPDFSGTSSSPLSESPGGIDMNDIGVQRQGVGVDIQFDPVQIQQIMNMDFDGFTPIIIDLVPLPSVLPLLGLAPQREEEEFELSQL